MEYVVTYPKHLENKEISMRLDNFVDACETAIHISKNIPYNVYVTHTRDGRKFVIQYYNGVHQWSRDYV